MKILVCDPMPEDFKKILEDKGYEVCYLLKQSSSTLKEVISEYDAVVVRSSTKITSDIIEAGSKLKVIARAGAGLDNIDVEAANKKGIRVINVPEAVANAVAELTLGLILSLLRSLPNAVESLRMARWEKHTFIGRELAGMTVGVVGMGNIGSLVAKKLLALGANVITYRRNKLLLESDSAKIGARSAKSLEELLKVSEIVTLHVPYTKETHHLLNSKNITLMQKGSYLVNTSRAWVVEGKALIKALSDGTFEGVAIDVHYNEPPQEDWEWQLIRHPKVIATPHIGAQTWEARTRTSILLAEKLAYELQKAKS
ncbi:MAG: hydroxyacid dehydrogenase [Thermofilaceae archaeon]|nr:hydroxyacid dehydrogenase [Thermofilaceae archaeon]